MALPGSPPERHLQFAAICDGCDAEDLKVVVFRPPMTVEIHVSFPGRVLLNRLIPNELDERKAQIRRRQHDGRESG